jgi:hypothetical protein
MGGWVGLTVNKVRLIPLLAPVSLHLLKPPAHTVMTVWLSSFSFAFQYQLGEDQWAQVTELRDHKTHIHAHCFSF